ncbi:MAG: glycosyltransferase, partial [Acidimicrobiia bacterium]|nr:glycosyltransferase [Acidimicrobiia bacterium]
VSSELAPYTSGGAGVAVAALVSSLRADGHRARVVLVSDAVADVDEEWVEVVAPEPDDISRFLGASKAASAIVARLAHGVDLFEFQDFHGLGYWSLMRRRSLGLETTRIVVRAHGPTDLISRHVAQPDASQKHVSVMERQAFVMADAVICSGEAIADVLADEYELERDRVLVSPPPVTPLSGDGKLHRSGHPEVVFLGTVAEVKGATEFVEAAVEIAQDDERARFRLVGTDGWHSSEKRPMSASLLDRIPVEVRHQFEFVGALDRDELAPALSTAWAVVTPSRFETFCLAAHEARQLGLPVVVPHHEGFSGFFSLQTGALVYDGTIPGLRTALQTVVEGGPTLDRLMLAPAPTYPDPTALYRTELPDIRHSRVQAGLATAALARLEEAIAPPPPEEPPELHTRVARWLNRLPFPIARWVSDRIPAGHPYRSLAAWHDAFRERQPETERRRALVKAAKRHRPDPIRVSIVVACYNQGEFLEEALYSVLAQTLRDWEIIVVNDGSDDRLTLELLDDIELPRTRIHHQKNAGLPAARNAGMRQARGEYVVPLDADDMLEPEFLKTLVGALDDDPSKGVAHCWTRLFGDLNQIWIPRPFNRYQMLLSNSLVGCAVVRTDVWKAVGGYDEHMTLGNEDWDFWLRMIEHDVEMIEVTEPLFRYRRHGITMSVETEARFETARREVAKAHSGLYDGIAQLKSEHYPLVSVLMGPNSDADLLTMQDISDAEVIPISAETPSVPADRWRRRDPVPNLEAAVATAKGKFVIMWDHVVDAGAGDLDLLARHLEADDDAYAAGPSDSEPVLWRRWSLQDPSTRHTHVAIVPGMLQLQETPDWRARFVDPRYVIVPNDFDVDVIQVTPETEGRIPEWVRS